MLLQMRLTRPTRMITIMINERVMRRIMIMIMVMHTGVVERTVAGHVRSLLLNGKVTRHVRSLVLNGDVRLGY